MEALVPDGCDSNETVDKMRLFKYPITIVLNKTYMEMNDIAFHILTLYERFQKGKSDLVKQDLLY